MIQIAEIQDAQYAKILFSLNITLICTLYKFNEDVPTRIAHQYASSNNSLKGNVVLFPSLVMSVLNHYIEPLFVNLVLKSNHLRKVRMYCFCFIYRQVHVVNNKTDNYFFTEPQPA